MSAELQKTVDQLEREVDLLTEKISQVERQVRVLQVETDAVQDVSQIDSRWLARTGKFAGLVGFWLGIATGTMLSMVAYSVAGFLR